MVYTQDIISKFQNAIVPKSQSLLGVTKSAEICDTANYMDTSEIESSNMRSNRNNIASSNNCKMVKDVSIIFMAFTSVEIYL